MKPISQFPIGRFPFAGFYRTSFKVLFLIIFTLAFAKSNAQIPFWQWAHNIPTSGLPYGPGNPIVAQPSNGDVYLTGRFRNTIDLDPGENVFNLTATGMNDVFFIKFNSSGEFIWAKSFSAQPNTNVQALSMDIDPNGNISATGSHNGLTDFDPGEEEYILSPGWICSAFKSTLSPEGTFVSAWGVTGILGCVEGNSIDVNTDGSVQIAGQFDGTPMDFDPGPGETWLGGPGNGSYTSFIMSVNPSGNLSWAREFCGFSPFKVDETNDVITDLASGDVYLTGQFHADCNFEKGSTQHTLTSGGESDIFISKYDHEGFLQWARSFGGATEDTGLSLSIDHDGFLYGTGIFTSSIEVEELDTIFSSAGSTDIFIFKMNEDGELVWLRTLGGVGDDTRSSVVVDQAAGEIILAGEFTDTVDFNPGVEIQNEISEGKKDIFILGLDYDGEFRWVKTVGGTGDEIKAGIALSNNHLYVGGDFDSPFFWLDKTVLVEYSSSPNGLDNMFVAKLDLNRSVAVEETEKLFFEVYPNPVEGELHVAFEDKFSQSGIMSLVNMQGITVLSEKRNIVNGKASMNCEGIIPGIYILQWRSERQQLTRKIIKQ